MFLIKSFTFNPFQENTYVLYNEKDNCIIFDPGCYYEHEKEELSSFISKNHLKPVRLVNTHCHLDHVFGNKFISETYHLELLIHKLEKPLFDLAPATGAMYELPFENYTGKVNFIDQGDCLSLDNDYLSIIFSPGHSPGSLCFYSSEQAFLIGGDVLFRQSIGRYDLPGGDGNLLLKSIREKLLPLPENVVVYPGHGPSTTIGEEKMHNPFLI